jgi:apolipoprotein D and lipocalin family protein
MLSSLLFAMVLTAGDLPSVKPVPTVDLQRYAGTWYEIARYPNFFQKSCQGDVTATYRRRPDGRIDVLNKCRKADGSMNEAAGEAKIVDGGGNARLKVRFAPGWLSALPFVWADYWVIGLADDYRWAVVATPDRKYLWVLGRSTTLDEADWAAAVAKAKENGFDTARLQRTAQRRDDPAGEGVNAARSY